MIFFDIQCNLIRSKLFQPEIISFSVFDNTKKMFEIAGFEWNNELQKQMDIFRNPKIN
jgi:hypothetical protein